MSGDQKGELSHLHVNTGGKKKKKKDSFLGKGSANEKSRALCLLQPSQLPFPLYESLLLPLPCGDLHVAGQACRP